jgi:hypothetical protein
MPSAGAARALVKAPASTGAGRGVHQPKPAVSIAVRQGAHCFFWVVGLVGLNAVFEIMGSQVHRFTGLGVSAIMGRWTSGISIMQMIVTLWVASGFLFLGYLAVQGQKWAFVVGMAAYAVDAALMVAAGDNLGALFHALMLYGIYRGLAALGPEIERSETASAAYAG